MPELPEVETVRNVLKLWVNGRKIKDTNIFGEINDFLTSKGIEPINWSLGKIRK